MDPETVKQPVKGQQRTVSSFRTIRNRDLKGGQIAFNTDVFRREVSRIEIPKEIIAINVDVLNRFEDGTDVTVENFTGEPRNFQSRRRC